MPAIARNNLLTEGRGTLILAFPLIFGQVSQMLEPPPTPGFRREGSRGGEKGNS